MLREPREVFGIPLHFVNICPVLDLEMYTHIVTDVVTIVRVVRPQAYPVRSLSHCL